MSVQLGARKLKGALLLLRPDSKKIVLDSQTLLVFQFNPSTISHTINYSDSDVTVEKNENKKDVRSIVHKITLNLEFDAADQLEYPNKNKVVAEKGLHPILAVLESIMYSQFQNDAPASPVVLFVWGINRIIPVWIDSLKVFEEAFDSNLNPIRLTVEVNMRLRNLSEMKKKSLGSAIFASHSKKRLMLTRLHGENKENREYLEQLTRSIKDYLVKSESGNPKESW